MIQRLQYIILDVMECEAVAVEIGERFHACTANAHILLFGFLKQHAAVALRKRKLIAESLSQCTHTPDSLCNALNIAVFDNNLVAISTMSIERILE